jgi:ribosome-associated protein YbcJ (S4-like RNA binding protein)
LKKQTLVKFISLDEAKVNDEKEKPKKKKISKDDANKFLKYKYS